MHLRLSGIPAGHIRVRIYDIITGFPCITVFPCRERPATDAHRPDRQAGVEWGVSLLTVSLDDQPDP